ncbi:MAG: hypothetical protein RLZZ396_2146 [Planctomycetota bacterium]
MIESWHRSLRFFHALPTTPFHLPHSSSTLSQATDSHLQEYPNPVDADHETTEWNSPDIPAGSVTGNLLLAQRGDREAFTQLWSRYFKDLVVQVRNQFQSVAYKQLDPEEVAHSTFIALHEGFHSQKFTSLHGRNQLWSLLTIIAIRKASNRARREQKFRRLTDLRYAGDFQQVGATRFSLQHLPVLDDAIKKILLEDHLEFLLRTLETEGATQRLREIALRKLQGQSNVQIAKEFGCSRKSIALRLNLIFEIWKQGYGI